jgi:hypothetical protein
MQSFQHLVQTVFSVFFDGLMFLRLWLRPSAAVAAENLFLRKQLGLFVERRVKPRRANDSIRFTLGQLSRWFDWREALIVVHRETLTRWHRKGFRLFWKWKSRPRGRPPVPADVRRLIREMARSNPTWGEERIADELLLKIGIRISPRTVRQGQAYSQRSESPRFPEESLHLGMRKAVDQVL